MENKEKRIIIQNGFRTSFLKETTKIHFEMLTLNEFKEEQKNFD